MHAVFLFQQAHYDGLEYDTIPTDGPTVLKTVRPFLYKSVPLT